MSIPTPSVIGQRLTQQKQHAMREADQTKLTQRKPESSTEAGSKVSRSSRQAKGSVTSSKSEPMRHSTRKNSSKRPSKPSTSEKPAIEPATGSEKAEPTVKKPFVRKEHLTQRLSSNEKLRELRDAMTPRHPNRGQEKKSSARKGGTPNPKTTSSTSNAK